MKKLIRWTMILSLFIFTAVFAADEDMEKQKKLLGAAKIELNNMEWKIKLSPMSGTNATAYEDTLLFVNSKFSSEKLESEKFPISNYTVSLKGEDVIIWETMQTSESGGLAFWRGELEGNVMRGVLSVRTDEETSMDFSFYSIQRKELEPKPPKIEEELTPKSETAKEIKETPKQTEEEKPSTPQKKRWWQW
ncbi:MAG: hypothetical protein PHW62_01275 [Candidatus Ratteibacteria bacterium]|nr:hypothetical protein [Candidatus Ratteibacteria bacterium]